MSDILRNRSATRRTDTLVPQSREVERDPHVFFPRQNLILAIVASVCFSAGIVVGRANPEVARQVRDVMMWKAERADFVLSPNLIYSKE